MVTRFRVGTNRPPERLNLYVSTISPLPKSYNEAINDSNWQNSMQDDYNVLIKIILGRLCPDLRMRTFSRSLYGLKHASQAWFQRFTAYITHVDFSHNRILVVRNWSDMFLSQRADDDPVSDPTLHRSLAGALYVKVEYRGITYAIAETCWLRNQLRKLHNPLSSATLAYYDNVSVVYLSSNLVQHQRTNPIEIDIHFVRDLVTAIQVRVLHVPSRYQWGWRHIGFGAGFSVPVYAPVYNIHIRTAPLPAGAHAVIWKNKCESPIPCRKPSSSITREEENSVLSLERESSLEHI
ncbi:ribonuclease H-like domain-containing protein [Tanacetum coccineum]|uniref:Ribonuclease H-like domain-containing protein n=1 Tax=Tanacetum coccineum TaxID=301880 RepID=A0ABQ4WMM8_9ASTR